MTIAEMHVWFRQYAQQMGMQNVRAILPEQIDIMINTSITDTVNQVIAQNVNISRTGGVIDNSKLGQINALSPLYEKLIVDATPNDGSIILGRPFMTGNDSYIKRIYANIADLKWTEAEYYVIIEKHQSGQAIYQAEPSTKEVYDAAENKVDILTEEELEDYEDEYYVGYAIRINPSKLSFEYLYLVDFSLNYINSSNNTTNYFPVRILDEMYLADALNDFLLRPRVKTPIAVIYNNQISLYLDVLEGENGNKHLPKNLVPHDFHVGYIRKPNKVKYDSVTPTSSVPCDLPEYMHVDILKHAVDLYRIAVNNGMYGNQQQQVQNPSTTRQVGTGGEGYQS